MAEHPSIGVVKALFSLRGHLQAAGIDTDGIAIYLPETQLERLDCVLDRLGFWTTATSSPKRRICGFDLSALPPEPDD